MAQKVTKRVYFFQLIRVRVVKVAMVGLVDCSLLLWF